MTERYAFVFVVVFNMYYQKCEVLRMPPVIIQLSLELKQLVSYQHSGQGNIRYNQYSYHGNSTFLCLQCYIDC